MQLGTFCCLKCVIFGGKNPLQIYSQLFNPGSSSCKFPRWDEMTHHLTISKGFTFQLANIATNTLNENDGQFTEPSNQDEVKQLDHFPKYGWTVDIERKTKRFRTTTRSIEKTCVESQLPCDLEDSGVLKRSSFNRKIPSSLAPNR